MKKQADILTQYAEIDEAHVDALLQEELRRNRKKLVVLDDDPTGVQTVHDVSVYTHWTPEDLAAGFQEEENLFYVLTNSRGFTEAETIKAHREVAEATDKAAKAAGSPWTTSTMSGTERSWSPAARRNSPGMRPSATRAAACRPTSRRRPEGPAGQRT